MQKTLKNILTHILAWLLLLLLPTFIIPRPPEFLIRATIPPPPPPEFIFFMNVPIVLFYYLNYFVLIPQLFFKRRKILYFIIVLFISLILIYNPLLTVDESDDLMSILFKTVGLSIFRFLFIIVLLISLVVKFDEERTKVEKQKKQIENEKLKAELSLLKSQINPHFLFNTLNTIYSMILAKSEKSADAVIRLSKMMRYVINEADDEKVPLNSEINYVSNYILLQQTRLAKNNVLTIDVQQVKEDYQIVPLLLISFIENAFKHGTSSNEKSFVEISIFMEESVLNLFVKNKLLKKEFTIDESTGIGIENTKRRLELLYPGKYELEIKKNEEDYSTQLKIDLS